MSMNLLSAGRVTDIPMLNTESGVWRLERFTVDDQEEKWEQMRSLFSSSRGRGVPAGYYTRLMRGGTLVMSDTPDELDDLLEFASQARGRILIHGLGLGCALNIALAKESVTHIDVVEISPDVLTLVVPYFPSRRVTFHTGDAYTFRFPPGTRWDCVWHDVWDYISTDNDFTTLHRRYGRRCDWQGSWCRDRAERYS